MPPNGRSKDAWRSKPQPGQPAGRHRGSAAGGSRRWLGAALLLAALGGVIAGLFFYFRPDPEPVLLAVPVTLYDHPDWPPNPWAEADARGLRDRFAGDSAQAFQIQEKARILRQLAAAADDSRGAAKGRPLVVYLSALGLAVEGKAFLIPGDGRPDDSSGWMTLDDVLQPLRRTDVPRLLILDVRPATAPRATLATEDVNELLDAALAKLDQAGDLPFLVLTANTPPDGPNVIRPLKRTAFGLALAQAAGGAADGWNPERTKDNRVSARELAAYVRGATHTAAVAGGFPPQLPRLHGTGADFHLLHVPKDGPAALPTPDDPEPYPPWLADGWKDRDTWVKDGLHRRAPRATLHLTAATARAELRWLAGLEPKTVADQFGPIAADLRAVAKTMPAVVPPVRSVARARDNPAVNEKAAEAAFREVFDKIREPAPSTPEKPAPPLPPVKMADAEPFDASAAAIFSFALGLENPTHEQIKLLAAVVNGIRPRPRHAELSVIDLIAGLPPDQVKRWPAGTTRRILLATRAAEDAAVFDGRSLPWVRGALATADTTRRTALKTLCDPESPDATIRTAVQDLDRAREGYAAVRDVAAGLDNARIEYEGTRAGLADLAVWFPDNLAPVPEAVASTWAALVEDMRQLRVLLRPPAEPALPSFEELTRVTQSVRANRERLRAFITVPAEATQRQLEAALLWPWWTGAERTALLARLDRTGREVLERVAAKWPAEPGPEPATPATGSPRVLQDSARSLRRVAELLRLADDPETTALAAKVTGLGGKMTAREVAEFGPKLRTFWRERLPATYKTADPVRQADLGWLIDPDDVPAFPRAGIAYLPNPEWPDRRVHEKAFQAWLGESRYRADAAALRAVDLKATRDAAAALDALARDHLEWTP